MAGFIYQDAYLVWNTLRIIAESIELQQASTLRFELDEIVQDALSQEEKNLVTQLSVDDLVIISDIQGTVAKYLSEREAHRCQLIEVLGTSCIDCVGVL